MTRLTETDVTLAAEYVLKLLDRAEEAQAQARIATDADFAAEVAAWNARFEPYVGQAPAEPPAHIWSGIEAKLGQPTLQDRVNQRVRLWQGFSFVSASVAAVLSLLLINQPAVAPPQLPLVAALGQANEPSTMTASYDRETGALILTPVSLKTGDLFPELWLIDHSGTAHSLGIIAHNHPSKLVVPERLRILLTDGVTLAVTPEPNGGAPGGKATGPVIASGKITSV